MPPVISWSTLFGNVNKKTLLNWCRNSIDTGEKDDDLIYTIKNEGPKLYSPNRSGTKHVQKRFLAYFNKFFKTIYENSFQLIYGNRNSLFINTYILITYSINT